MSKTIAPKPSVFSRTKTIFQEVLQATTLVTTDEDRKIEACRKASLAKRPSLFATFETAFVESVKEHSKPQEPKYKKVDPKVKAETEITTDKAQDDYQPQVA